jgi:TolB-like protein/DNA-binding winged helix-turn-helix (wHTH) protein/Tfp pilus assembly protein PilF
MNLQRGFSVGDWEVYPLESRMIRADQERRVQPKSMDVLVRLAEQAGSAVERDELLVSVWGERAQSDEPLTRCIGELRRAFGDSHSDSKFIETIHKRGYKLLPPVKAISQSAGGAEDKDSEPVDTEEPVLPAATQKKYGLLLIATLTVAMLAAIFLIPSTESPSPDRADAIREQRAGQHTIAVLPFENLSGDAVNDPFTDGIHDDILAQISRISALRVISRTSTLGYRDTDKDLKTIGRELNADGILEGSVQRSGNRIRINAQLILAETDTHLWSESYDRELTAANIFAIQSEIATAIADRLRASMTPEEKRLIRSVPTENLAALEAYFRGKLLMGKRTTEATLAAQEFFEEAIELDPGMALAWVGLAQNYSLQIFNSGETDGVLFSKAEAAIKRSLDLEDQLGEAHATLGRLMQLRGDSVAAEVAMKRAIELSPNNVYVNHAYGLFLDFAGRAPEAVDYLRKAKELDPRAPVELVGYGGIMEGLGRFDEALEHFEKSIEIDPMFAPGYRLIGHLEWLVEGRLDNAVEVYAKAIELDPGRIVVPAILGRLYLDLGDLEMADAWISHVKDMAPRSFHAARAGMFLDVYRGRGMENFQYPGDLHTAVINAWPTLGLQIAADLNAGNVDRARQRLETAYPDLMAIADPEITRINLTGAIDLAYLLQRTGEQDAASELLERALSFARSIPRLGWTGGMISDVRIYALQGKTDDALEAFRAAIDEGWRNL